MTVPGAGPHIFGIRHLSPGGAYHLLRFLDEINPTAVLVEGPSDAEAELGFITAEKARPPLAILAYSVALPVRTILYPFAVYSPEYQALLWAHQHGVPAHFIDLPSGVFLALEYADPRADADGAPETDLGELYRRWAEIAGEPDHETYWERYFEHNLEPGAYRAAAREFGRSLRELSRDGRRETAVNLVREAYMRRRISEIADTGHDPGRIVVVTGAFHTEALSLDLTPMTDRELAALPKLESRWTLMPYSYFKLSTQSGYGAGNQAPAYYEMLWECLRLGDPGRLPARYLATLAGHLRAAGTYRSPAEVIEGVRLADSLAALHGGCRPTLKDLRDAAVVCLGHGHPVAIAQAAALTEVGTALGELPEGVSRTPIQDDFYRALRLLKLERYKTAVAVDLDLDLRENRRVQSEAAAYLDLQRSFFLHRLVELGVSFAKPRPAAQQNATWAETWTLQWTPEAEIALVESTLRGETVELAAAFALQERLDGSAKVDEAAAVIGTSCACGLPAMMDKARVRLQQLAVDSGAFGEIAAAARSLAVVIGYGDIRRLDVAHFIPLLQQLFVKGALLLVDAAACNDEASHAVLAAVNAMHAVAVEHFRTIDEELWLSRLGELATRDDRNPRLSGYACAILLERNTIDEQSLAREVSRRLSPGIDADLGAGWFEGLSLRNRYALLSRAGLWAQLDAYLASLDPAQFRRALVYLRRAFGGFSPAEKRSIAETLGEIWGIGGAGASDYLNRPLNEEEKKQVESLKDFDFDEI